MEDIQPNMDSLANGEFAKITEQIPSEYLKIFLSSITKERVKIAQERLKEEFLHENSVLALKRSLDDVLKENKEIERQRNFYKKRAEQLERESAFFNCARAYPIDDISEIVPYELDDDDIDALFVSESNRRQEQGYRNMLQMARRSIERCVDEAEDLSLERNQAVEYETVLRMMVDEVWRDYLEEVDIAYMNSKISEILPERRKREKKLKNTPPVYEKHYHDNAKYIEHIDHYNEI